MQTTGLPVRKRILALFLLFIVMFFALEGRVFWIQFIKGAELSAKATQNRTRDVPVEAKRGTITDCNGRELAISISTDSVYAIPAEIIKSGKSEQIAQQLAEVLDMDETTLLQRITRASSFEWVKRQINPAAAKTIRELELSGIGLTEESRRFYPRGTLASHILGISGIDNTGLEGIDQYYDSLVGGTEGRIIIEHDATGANIPEAMHEYIAPVDGANLTLTIDETIQYITERELDKAFTEFEAKQAAAIVMDPTTGAILAMSSRPTFDPNNYDQSPNENRRNFAINDAYEPGSTMKITTSAMALEEKIVNDYSQFYCPGQIKVLNHSISCASNKAHGSQTFAEIVENSCNVGFVQVGLDLGLERYYKYLNDFGFGRKTGIDLPGEAEGILVPQSRATQLDLATMAMGQANAVTALQLVAAVSAVANGGKLMKPYLLHEAVDNNGNVIKKNEPQMIKQIISEEAAHKLCMILEGEVTQGTGKNAYIEGYRVGGKTGTAQKIKPGGGYMDNEYVSSFIGLAPADNPRLVCIIVVDAPQGYPYYGGTVAAPGVREILKDSLLYMNVPMNGEAKESMSDDAETYANTVLVPDLVNLSLTNALNSLEQRGLNAKVEGQGELVWQQIPKARARIARGSQIIVYLSPYSGADADTEVTVPDITGKSMKEVAKILADLNLHLMPEGYGISCEQSPPPGKIISTDSTIKVKFQPLE